MFLNKIKSLKMEYQELKELYSEIQDSEKILKTEVERLLEIEANNEFVESVLKKGNLIDGVEFNKSSVKYYVCVSMDSKSVTLSLQNKRTGHPYPRLYAKFYQDIQNPFNVACHIVDVFAVEEDVGNGSILIQYLIKWAKKMDACQVNGMLSCVDIEKFDKLERFYKKNGFTVNFNKNRTSGSIKLNF
ncbi:MULTISPECIES: GNAT family N-acetyltransferase [Bacillus cereus group]|nr:MULTISPECIES: GNAT family N-acetyltransferase [Bacillus cereus group]MDX5837235.1 GNAT family N-acetyltransferase [Bacillus cereus group sp. BfR-BA-01700]OJE31263.1 hypothetical protein BAQ44_22750 [Bacillus mobilis]